MDVFIKSSFTLMDYNKNDVVLDIGCGPGYLADNLAPLVKEIHCLDICDDFINNGKERFKTCKNVCFYRMDGKNYTDFSQLHDFEFTKMIWLTVIQYYNKRDHLKLLIRHVKKISQKGAKFLIADIPQNRNRKSEIFELLKVSIKKYYS
jgi:ubiquinone/menaquinone biosynthesis C-methylase UbiE